MEEEILLLSADTWEMVDENTGERRNGTSCFYIAASGIEPKVNTDTSLGYKPLKASMPLDFFKTVLANGGCPCKAKAHYIMKVSNGQQILKVDSIEFPTKK